MRKIGSTVLRCPVWLKVTIIATTTSNLPSLYNKNRLIKKQNKTTFVKAKANSQVIGQIFQEYEKSKISILPNPPAPGCISPACSQVRRGNGLEYLWMQRSGEAQHNLKVCKSDSQTEKNG